MPVGEKSLYLLEDGRELKQPEFCYESAAHAPVEFRFRDFVYAGRQEIMLEGKFRSPSVLNLKGS